MFHLYNITPNCIFHIFSPLLSVGLTLSGLTIFPCPQQSCRDRCGSPATEELCGCDSVCSHCDDCCYDYSERCSLQQAATNGSDIFAHPLEESFSCKILYLYDRALIVDGCNKDWNDTVVALQCANVSLPGPIQYANGPFFQNVYCAECNGITAYDLVNNSEYFSFRLGSSREVIAECSLNVSLEIESACRIYNSKVYYNSTAYKNLHCAYCNGLNISAWNYCRFYISSVAPGHFEILLGRNVDPWFPETSTTLLLQDEIHCYNKESQLRIHSNNENNSVYHDDATIESLITNVTRCYILTLGWQNIQLTWPFYVLVYHEKHNFTC